MNGADNPLGDDVGYTRSAKELSDAFLMGLAAAVPMGPVNMLAIRRGVIGGWRHPLAAHPRPWFAPVRTKLETHLTPWGAPQSFQFSMFKRIWTLRGNGPEPVLNLVKDHQHC